MTLITSYQSQSLPMPELCYQHLCALAHSINLRSVTPLARSHAPAHVCPARYTSNHLYYSPVSLRPTPFLFLSSLSTSFLLFFPDDSTSQAQPSETSPLLSNGKSISQFVNVSFVLLLSSHFSAHTHTATYAAMRMSSLMAHNAAASTNQSLN